MLSYAGCFILCSLFLSKDRCWMLNHWIIWFLCSALEIGVQMLEADWVFTFLNCFMLCVQMYSYSLQLLFYHWAKRCQYQKVNIGYFRIHLLFFLVNTENKYFIKPLLGCVVVSFIKYILLLTIDSKVSLTPCIL